MKCLWCSRDTTNQHGEHPFCVEGGINVRQNNKLSKSFCMDCFVSIYNFDRARDMPKSEQDLFYELHQSEIEDWYKKIPLVRA